MIICIHINKSILSAFDYSFTIVRTIFLTKSIKKKKNVVLYSHSLVIWVYLGIIVFIILKY